MTSVNVAMSNDRGVVDPLVFIGTFEPIGTEVKYIQGGGGRTTTQNQRIARNGLIVLKGGQGNLKLPVTDASSNEATAVYVP